MKLSELNKEVEKVERVVSKIKPILKRFTHLEDSDDLDNLSDSEREELLGMMDTMRKLYKELGDGRV